MFDVYFGTSSNPPRVSIRQTPMTYTPAGPLTVNTRYYWKVVAINLLGTVTGPIWSFVTQPDTLTAPATPNTPTPADSAVSVTVLPRLLWTAERATNYSVYFGNGLFNYTGAVEQPNGSATVPILARDLWFGYFYSYSEKYGYDENAPENFVFVEDLPSFAMAVATQRKMLLSIGAPVTAPVTYGDTTGHEALIIGEGVSGGTQAALASAAAAAVSARGGALAGVPMVGICDGFLPTSSVANVDWLAIEAYVATASTAAACEAAIRNCLDTVAFSAGQKFVIIGHSFTSNANFAPSDAELMAAQYIPANLAADYADVLMLIYFAWARPSGVIYDPDFPQYPDHEPAWRPVHEAIFDGIRYRDYGLANYTITAEQPLLTSSDRLGPAWFTCPDEWDDGWVADVVAADPPVLAATALVAAEWSPPRLAPNQTYPWRIVASNAAGSTFGPEWDFSTGVPAGATPTPPSTPSPWRGTTDVPLSIILTWKTVDATSCDVYFGTNSSPVLMASGVTSSQFIPPTMSAGVTYYWQIVARNAYGTTYGPLWYFTTSGATGPDTPSAPTPAIGATDIAVDVTFTWAPSARADWYTFGIGTTFPPTPALYPNDSNPTKIYTPSFQLAEALLPSTRYYWYVQAWNATGRATSEIWSFVTKAPTTPPPATFPPEPTGHTIDVDGYFFRTTSNNALWRWQGASYFGMLSDYLGSGIVAGVYDWARSVGVNVFRVFTMKCGDPRRRGNGFPWAPLLPTDYTDQQLDAFLTAVEAEGFYVQLVCLADCSPETDTGADPAWAGLPTLAAKQAHVTRIANVAANHHKTFVELANEPYVNGVTETDLLTLTCASGVWVCKGSGEAPYPYKPAWHYGTEHSPRTTSLELSGTASWPRRAKNLREYEREGGEGTSGDNFPPFNIPFVGNEPMGMDEQAVYPVNGTERSWTAQDHADYHAVAAVFASGSTIHLQCLGLEGTLPVAGSDQARCVEAVRQVWEDLPIEAKAGTYTAGHLSTCPLLQNEDTVAKIYGTISGNEAWIVTVGRNMATYVEQVRAGWEVVARYGYNNNIVKLRRI